ncbi:MAG: integration host factor subunit alpha [Pseudomonadota bacterium]
MAITKADLVKKLTQQGVLKRKESKKIVDCLIEAMKKALASGDDLLISGFGKFSVRHRGHKRVRNPRTGDEFLMDPRKVVSFRVSPVLRRRVNQRTPDKVGGQQQAA